MTTPESNPPYRDRDPNNDITLNTLNALGKKIKFRDGTFIQAENELLPLCKMCSKSPMTCENDINRWVEAPMEPGDDPNLEVKSVKLSFGKISEEEGLGFKYVDGVKTGFYKTADDIPEPSMCGFFTPKGSG